MIHHDTCFVGSRLDLVVLWGGVGGCGGDEGEGGGIDVSVEVL